MSSSEPALDFGDAVLGAVLEALSPVVAAAQDRIVLYRLVDELGWVMPQADVPGAIAGLAGIADGVTELVAALDAYRAAGEVDAATIATLIEGTANLVTGVARLADQPTTGLPEPLSLPEFWTSMATELPGLLLARYLRRQSPLLHAVLLLFGILDRQTPAAGPWRIEDRQVDVLRWDRLGTLVSDPGQLMADVYGWGGTLRQDVLLRRLRDSLIPLGVDAFLREPDKGLLERHFGVGTVVPDEVTALRARLYVDELGPAPIELGVEAFPVPQALGLPDPVGLFLGPYGSVALTTGVDLTENVRLTFTGTADSSGMIGVALRPGGVTPLLDPASLSGRLALRLGYAPPETAALIGRPGETGVSLAGCALTLALVLDDAEAEVIARLELSKLTLSVDFSQADGFLATVTGGLKAQTVVDGALSWSSTHGLVFEGGAGLTITIPIDLDLGPLTVSSITVSVDAGTAGVQFGGGLTAALNLGPFVGVIDGIGVAMMLSEADDGPAFGLAPTFALKPPVGAGLAIDTPAISGGGFLRLEQGKYSGVFELTIVGTLSVKVIGIITTQLPDGSPGFALLLIITAEGFTPIQLGMGFVLTGIGGLIALNRTIDVDAVRTGLSNGVLDSVLFAKDPVANADRILTTLETIFPFARDRLLIGPLAEIGWGSPPLVKVRLALLLEIPQPIRVVLLAALSIALPTEDLAIVELHVDAIGVLDLGRGELALDASLHHSHLWKFTLTGDMALRLNWGSDPMFLMSVGGFHPGFTPPAGLRKLERLRLSLSDSENPLVRLETYLAVTANTIQMGARVQVRVEAGGFGAEGGGAFDALVQWVPFRLDVNFQAWVSVFTPTGPLCAARLELHVTGPQPWHVVGVARVQLLAFEVEAAVDFTVGDPPPPLTVESVDVAHLLWEEVSRPESWTSALPADQTPGVTLGALDAADAALLVHPLDVLSVRQKVVPLATHVTRVGAQRPQGGARKYELEVDSAAGIGAEPLLDRFAPAQFTDPTEDQKLSAPSFVSWPAGVSFAPQPGSGLPVGLTTDLAFETLELTSFDTPAASGGGTAPPVAEQLELSAGTLRDRAGLAVVPA